MARFDSLSAWLVWQEQSHPRLVDLGLDRVTQVYAKLGLHLTRPPTITVGGTNGKGSCVALLSAIYRAQGYKVGAYTSPHILHYNERICIDGVPASDAAICNAFERIDAARDGVSLSFFEFGTLAALILFAEAEVDVRLLEVGLGGRLDAVNIVDSDAAIITTVALDHMDWLGATVEAIGREKAGIFRAGVPAIIGESEPPQSVLDSARQTGARLLRFGRDFYYRRQDNGWEWRGGEVCLPDLPPPAFPGEHQYRNAAASVMAVVGLRGRLPVSAASVAAGVGQARLLGRFQLIPGEPPVLLEVGHNPQAVETLCEHLRERFAETTIHAVFAMMKDKDIASVVALMRDYVHMWYLAPLPGNKRAAGEDLMRRVFAQLEVAQVRQDFGDFSEAFAAASAQAKSGELILVFGSFFLVSEYLAKFSQR